VAHRLFDAHMPAGLRRRDRIVDVTPGRRRDEDEGNGRLAKELVRLNCRNVVVRGEPWRSPTAGHCAKLCPWRAAHGFSPGAAHESRTDDADAHLVHCGLTAGAPPAILRSGAIPTMLAGARWRGQIIRGRAGAGSAA